MNKIEIPLERARAEMRDFYDEGKHHFVVMNGIDLGDKVEVQWFFATYEAPAVTTCFSAMARYDDVIPSITDFVTSAWVTEAEFVDLFDVKVEGATKGFVLDADGPHAPLRRSK